MTGGLGASSRDKWACSAGNSVWPGAPEPSAGRKPALAVGTPCPAGTLRAGRDSHQFSHNALGLGSQQTRPCPMGPIRSFLLLFCLVQRKVGAGLGFESQLWIFPTEA